MKSLPLKFRKIPPFRGARGVFSITRKFSKPIAAFFIINMLTSIAAPYAAMALTSGPTAPEYTSISSFDSSTLINKLTGDMNYSIPILEIPSSSQSFPVGMSYNSGIKLNQESSWVGLGWNLNPGAISRTVNGFPDDSDGQILEVHDEWEGGTSYERGAGIPFKIAGLWLEKTWGTHQPTRFGYAYSFLHFGVDNRRNSPYKGIHIPEFKWLLHSEDFVDGVGLALRGLFDTFDGNLDNPHVSSRLGKIDEGGSFSNDVTKKETGVDLLFYRNIKTRYWIDDSEETKMYGSLYGSLASSDDPEASYDRYIMGEVITEPSIDDDPKTIRNNAEVMVGPSFRAYDDYAVSSYGLSGSIAPYILENATMYNKKKEELSVGTGTVIDVEYIKHKQHSQTNVPFKFKGEFSNHFKVDDVSNFRLDESPSETEIDFGSNGLGYSPQVESDMYVGESMELRKANVIRYYTNNEIRNNSDGFRMDYVGEISRTHFKGFSIGDQVGSFVITKPDGMTYHFSLPTYTYEQVEYFETTDWAGSESSRTTSRDHPYAYSWLLTSITGPDYHDKNGNSICDEGDWGYWTNFKYGKTTDSYKYRFPYEDSEAIIDDDGSLLTEEGLKELYYLDAIYSDTHTAIFSKDLSRSDAKGYNGNRSAALENIYLFKNSNFSRSPLNEINFISNIYSVDSNFNGISQNNSYVISKEDMSDYLINNNQKIVKQISLTHENELAPNTPNSSSGKLTLKKLSMRGKGGVDIIPPYRFNYEDEKSGSGILEGNRLTPFGDGNSLCEIGDILIVTYSSGSKGYHYVTSKTENYLTLSPLWNTGSSHQQFAYFSVTNNPPYLSGYYDSWGYFKSDYKKHISSNDTHQNDFDRIVTNISEKGVSSWNLMSLTNPTGLKITFDYETDTYQKIGVNNPIILNSKNKMGFFFDNNPDYEWLTQGHPNNYEGGHAEKFKMYFAENDIESIIRNSVSVGDLLPIVTYTRQEAADGSLLNTMEHDGVTYLKPIEGEILVEEIGDEFILFSDPNNIYIDFSNANGNASQHIHYFTYLKLPFTKKYGGGVRVSSITLEDMLNDLITERRFEYNEGATSFEPIGFHGLYIDSDISDWDFGVSDSQIDHYRRVYEKEFSRLMHISQELPPSNVLYGNVVESTYSNDQKHPSDLKYEFHVFDESMIIPEELDYQVIPTEDGEHESRTIKISNNTSIVGKVKSIRSTGINGENLYKKEYLYGNRDDLVKFNDQGIHEEVAHEHRVVTRKSNNQKYNFATVSIKSNIPSPLLEVKESYYKTNITTESKVLSFDFLSGSSTAVSYNDGYGNTYVTKKVPAYRFYPEMSDRNMLTQEGIIYTYLMDDDFLPEEASYGTSIKNNAVGLVSSSAQVWSKYTEVLDGYTSIGNQSTEDIYRKARNYQFIGGDHSMREDGTYPALSFSEAPIGSEASYEQYLGTSDEWQLNSTISKYDIYSHALEAIDVNYNFAATKFDINNERVIATVANAGYNQFAFSGAEDAPQDGFFGGNVELVGSRAEGDSHTGTHHVETTNTNKIGFRYRINNPTASKYLTSFWTSKQYATLRYKANNGDYEFAGGLPSHYVEPEEMGETGWYLKRGIIEVPSGASYVDVWTVGVSELTLHDDFRVQPMDANMTSYVYNKWGELSDILDANNLFTHYEYDAMGRLKSVTRETLSHGPVKVSESKIHYSEN